MLHADPAMIDIDIDHWRNLQSLVLDSARGKRRIVVIHDDGVVRKLAHSEGADIAGDVPRVDAPHDIAMRLYEDNRDGTDLVFVVERRALDAYFAAVAKGWDPAESIDGWVHRQHTTLDDFPDGIVTHPGPARDHLGLQWRIGNPYEQVVAAVHEHVAPDSTAVFGVFDGDALWASLVLGFDARHEITLVTTGDPHALHAYGRTESAAELLAQVEGRYPRCSYSLFTDRDGASELLAGPDKDTVVARLTAAGRLLTGR